MGMTTAEKLLAKAAKLETVSAGEIINAYVDIVMVDDSLGPTFIENDFIRLGEVFADKNKVVVISDHLTPPSNVDQAEKVATARRFAARYGLSYYENLGPCHQVLAEKGYDKPGSLIVGTDSHTVIAGAFGCFGTGIGSTESLSVIMTGEIWLRVPETISVVWNGALLKGVMGKDIIMRTIKDIGHAGATYKALEFSGGTIDALPMDERMCITSMSLEAGAKTGLMPVDRTTEAFLNEHGYVGPYQKYYSDPDAVISARYVYSAEELTPQVACPHEVDNVCDVSETDSIPIHQAYIGSCTGGRFTDLAAAAEIVRGKKIASGCRMLVSPASHLTYRKAIDAGIIQTLMDAGATIMAPMCGVCAALHSGFIAAGENCASTTNRNFKGRMGSYDGNIYLTSPATAAASAIAGHLTDPRHYL